MQIFLPLRLSPPPVQAFVVWTVPSPWPSGFRRRPSSLYTFPFQGLARDWHGVSPEAFPDFERFCTGDFPPGTPIEVCCVYQFRHVRTFVYGRRFEDTRFAAFGQFGKVPVKVDGPAGTTEEDDFLRVWYIESVEFAGE